MNWVLVLSLISAPDGLYARQFKTEAECVTEMQRLIKSSQGNPLVNGIACLNRDEFALNDSVKPDHS